MKITEYLTSKGVSPFGRWYKKLDKSLQTKVDEIVLLLIGGNKSSQSKDIEKAKDFLKDYKQRKDS